MTPKSKFLRFIAFLLYNFQKSVYARAYTAYTGTRPLTFMQIKRDGFFTKQCADNAMILHVSSFVGIAYLKKHHRPDLHVDVDGHGEATVAKIKQMSRFVLRFADNTRPHGSGP